MKNLNQRFVACGLFLIVAAMCTPSLGQTDRVYPPSGPLTSGTVINTNPNGVTVQVGGAERNFANALIKKIVFNDEPSPLTNARELIDDGQFEAALAQLTSIKIDGIERDVVKSDALFYLAYCQSKLALAGQGDKNVAIKNMYSFVTGKFGPSSFHFYQAARTLGDLALAVGSYTNAVKYYGALAGAQDPNLKFEAKYLTGWSYLKQKQYKEASDAFNAIGNAPKSTPEQARIKLFAAAGLAVIAAAEGKPDEGLATLNKLIDNNEPSDAELFGRLYNAQGACYAAKSDTLGAVLSYLKTHLLSPSNADAHAQALTELVQLWPQLGQPERGVEANSILQRRYPGYK